MARELQNYLVATLLLCNFELYEALRAWEIGQ